ncbi:MAG: hypothetical protein ACSHXL_08050 [Bacteroidota bacterium]
MNKLGFLLLLFLPISLIGQQNLLPISSFYKDQLLAPRNNSYGTKSSFYPRSEGEYDLKQIIRDSSKQYYEFTDHLFKKHLFEIIGEGYSLYISPVLNLAVGNDYGDTNERRLFNNTRGFLVEVDLLDKFSFSTALYENQNRFTEYESAYYRSAGERYPNIDSTYFVDNAMIPGGARTKPFKVDGFDYAYAIGNLVYAPTKYLRFMAGNNTNFVGEGYRSLFLSDNSVPSTYARADMTFAKRFDYTMMRSKQFNLLRRPIYTTVEAYYEAKLYSSQFLNFRASDKLSISLFEGSYWNVGDSISSKKVNAGYFIPLPYVGGLLANNTNEVSTLSGLQMSYIPIPQIRLYGQLALTNWNTKSIGSQVGMRYYTPFGLKEGLIQLEYNNVPKRLYVSDNSRLNYSASNLPSAHPKGNGFQEFIFRFNYSKKRWYADVKSVLYQLKNYEATNLIASNYNLTTQSGSIFHQQTEIGYRFNKKVNLELFVQSLYRTSSIDGQRTTNAIYFGLRTGLTNHYNDF